MTSSEMELYNKEIDAAMARIDNGEFTTHEDFMKELDELFDEKNSSFPESQIDEIKGNKGIL